MAPFLFSDPGRVGAEPLSPANPSICQPIPSEQLISGRSSGRRLEPRPECQRPPRGSLTRATLERRGRGRSGAERGDRGAASAEEQGIKARLSRPPPPPSGEPPRERLAAVVTDGLLASSPRASFTFALLARPYSLLFGSCFPSLRRFAFRFNVFYLSAVILVFLSLLLFSIWFIGSWVNADVSFIYRYH